MKKVIGILIALAICVAIPVTYHWGYHCTKCDCTDLATQGMFCSICLSCKHDVSDHVVED